MDALGSGSGQLFLSGRSDRIAQLAHVSLVDGQNNMAVGLSAGKSVKSGPNNVFLGSYAGANAIASGSVFLGTNAGRDATNVRNSVFLGYNAGALASRVDSSVCIGPFAGRKMTRANCNTVIGYQAGAELTSGSRNTVLGTFAAYSQFNGTDNVCVGHQSGYKNQVGSNNCYIGTNSGFSAVNGLENVCLGVSSGEQLYAGTKNVLAGYRAGANITNASNCIAIGTRAMEFFFDGDTNTCLGTETAKYFSGVNNTILGGYSTANASGNYNTIIGSRSMNRATKERVNLSNCVIVGENIQFDIPVRRVTANVSSLDLTPDFQTTPDILTLPDGERAYLEINVVPVGDPVLIRSRYISLGSVENPAVFDTSQPGTYVVRWGSAPSDTLDLLGPIPVVLTIDVTDVITLTLESYNDLIYSQEFDAVDLFDVFLEQTFDDPPAITLGVQGDTYTFTPELPGGRVMIDPSPTIDGTLVTVFATESVAVIKSQAIQILDGTIPQINGVWRIHDIGIPVDGKTPISFRVSEAPNLSTTPYLGPDVHFLSSRIVSVQNVTGIVTQNKLRLTIPEFAGMLSSSAQVLADGILYAVTVIDVNTGTFDIFSSNTQIAEICIGSFEPLIVGLDVTATGDEKRISEFSVAYNQRSDKGVQTSVLEGPTSIDGHSHRGAGTQAQMDAAISDGKLTFGDGLSFADYVIGTANSNVSTAATFSITNDAAFGVQWLDWYTLTCSVMDGEFGATLGYSGAPNRELANVTPSSVFVVGDMYVESEDEPTFPIVVAPGIKHITVSAEHRIRLRELDVRITITDVTTKTLVLAFRNTPPVSSASSRMSYFAANPATVSGLVIQNTNYQLYPSFSDCIFLGSNFTVGSQLPLDEKANVFVAAIGNVPLFKGTTDEFRFFSNTVTLNAVTVSDLVVTGNAVIVDVLTGNSAVFGDTLFVANAVDFGDDLTIAGNLDVQSVVAHGNARVDGSVVVQGSVLLQDTLDVTGDAAFANVSMTGLDSTTVVIQNTLTVGGNTDVQGMHAFSANIDTDVTVGGDFSVQGTLTGDSISLKNSSGSVATLDVNDAYFGTVKISGTPVGGWDGLRFPDSQMMLAFRQSQSGFYHEEDGWQLYVDNGSLYVRNNLVAFHSFSDIRLKTNLRAFDALDYLKQMPAYEFDWILDKKREIGLIAQDVRKVMPWAVSSSAQTNDHLVVDYSKLVPVLTGAVVQQSDALRKQSEDIKNLEDRVARLEKLLL